MSFLQCYSINTDRVATWEDARKQCITIGGNLVSIPTRRIQGYFCILIYLMYVHQSSQTL